MYIYDDKYDYPITAYKNGSWYAVYNNVKEAREATGAKYIFASLFDEIENQEFSFRLGNIPF